MSRARLRLLLAVCLVAAAAVAMPAAAEGEAGVGANGFDLSGATVPPDQIARGGPGRDGIRSVDDPTFAAPADATWVAPENPVLGVAVGDDARSYPVHVIERHQVVNDTIGGVPVVVSFDPLASTPRAYERKLGDRTLAFGVSGLVYNHNFLLYDRETQSLWVQYTGEAIAGPLAGERLVPRRIRQETQARWQERWPDTRVLARPAPREIDYSRSPFLRYIANARLLFPVAHADERYHPKEVVLTLVKDGAVRAYLGSVMTAAGGLVEEAFAGERVRISYATEEAVFEFDVPDAIRVEEAFWFSVAAFHPDVEVYEP